jgi:hypothetical protein
LEHCGRAKICKANLVLGRRTDEDIGRLQSPMRDPLRVSSVERTRELMNERNAFV